MMTVMMKQMNESMNKRMNRWIYVEVWVPCVDDETIWGTLRRSQNKIRHVVDDLMQCKSIQLHAAKVVAVVVKREHEREGQITHLNDMNIFHLFTFIHGVTITSFC